MRKIFVTGYPGCGKTRLIIQFANHYKNNITGFYTEEIREKGKRVGFKIRDMVSGKERIMAHVDFDGPKVSKYGVDTDAIEEIAIPALKRKADIYLIDEIGSMEMFSKKFEHEIIKLLTSDKNVLATLHRRYVNKFKNYGEVIILERKYWDKVFDKLLSIFQNI